MKRNNFIQLTFLGTGMLVLPMALNSCTYTEPEPRLAIPESLLSVCDSGAIIGIGKKYLEHTPQENNIEILAALVSSGLNPEKETFFAELRQKITEEYRNGQCVEVSGWLLATTEARQCALYSLINT